MKHPIRTLACGAALLATIAMTLVACGGKETMASKSAAAYDEAKKKGIPVALGEHGGHTAGGAGEQATGATSGEMDHGAMPGMDHAQMPGMDHSAAAVMDHSRMTSMPGTASGGQSMAGMDHSTMPAMKHGSSMTGMSHGSSPTPPPLVIAPPTSNAAIAETQPAATLRSDEFDAPAPSAVEEAAKASNMNHSTEPPAQHHHRSGETS